MTNKKSYDESLCATAHVRCKACGGTGECPGFYGEDDKVSDCTSCGRSRENHIVSLSCCDCLGWGTETEYPCFGYGNYDAPETWCDYCKSLPTSVTQPHLERNR
jgi:hypothetical protein